MTIDVVYDNLWPFDIWLEYPLALDAVVFLLWPQPFFDDNFQFSYKF